MEGQNKNIRKHHDGRYYTIKNGAPSSPYSEFWNNFTTFNRLESADTTLRLDKHFKNYQHPTVSYDQQPAVSASMPTKIPSDTSLFAQYGCSLSPIPKSTVSYS